MVFEVAHEDVPALAGHYPFHVPLAVAQVVEDVGELSFEVHPSGEVVGVLLLVVPGEGMVEDVLA